MHLVDLSVGFMGSTSIVGNTIPVSVGAAMANHLHKNGKICCVFFGDAAVEEGVFHESANFAVLKKLPVLFVCENNLYSVYSPLEEYLSWKERDPIALLEEQLVAQGAISQADIEEMEGKAQTEVDEAFNFAEESPFPDPEETFKGLYRE